RNKRGMEIWKTLRVSHIPTPPAATTDKCLTRRYTNTPLGTKDRSGQLAHGDIDSAVTPEPIPHRQDGSIMKNGRESFSAYLDKSEESSIDVYVVGGFVGKAEVWEELTTKWLDCFADWDYVLPCNRLLH